MTNVEQILKRLESRYQKIHQRRDLIGEHALSRDEFDQLTQEINTFVEESGRRLRQLCRWFPATTATFLVHCALYEYTASTANL